MQIGPFERLPRSTVPTAAIAFLLTLVLIETAVWRGRIWFADLTSWEWEAKLRLMEEGALDGDVCILGTSVLYHAIDPTAARERAAGRSSPVNLALTDLDLQHYAQIFEAYLARGVRVRLAVIELRKLDLARETWIRGPYFRHEASWSGFLESGVLFFEPSLIVPFAGCRALPSFAYREGLKDWISACVRSTSLETRTRDRNQAVAATLRERHGCLPRFVNARPLTRASTRIIEHTPWIATRSATIWLNRLIDTCERSGIEVVLLLQPFPPYVEADRARTGYVAGRDAFIASLRSAHPRVAIDVLAPTGFGLEDFVDTRHFSPAGQRKLSAQFAAWLGDRSGGSERK